MALRVYFAGILFIVSNPLESLNQLASFMNKVVEAGPGLGP